MSSLTPDQLISPSYYLYCNSSHVPHGFEAHRARLIINLFHK